MSSAYRFNPRRLRRAPDCPEMPANKSNQSAPNTITCRPLLSGSAPHAPRRQPKLDMLPGFPAPHGVHLWGDLRP